MFRPISSTWTRFTRCYMMDHKSYVLLIKWVNTTWRQYNSLRLLSFQRSHLAGRFSVCYLTMDSVAKTYWHLALTDVQMLPEHCWNDTDKPKWYWQAKTTIFGENTLHALYAGQIRDQLIGEWTCASAVISQALTVWAMEQFLTGIVNNCQF